MFKHDTGSSQGRPKILAMVKRTITISNKLGLHARAATKFANLALQYGCKIEVKLNDKTIDGKSIMSLMLLAACCGTEIEIHCNGDDANAALDSLCSLIENKFDEGE